RRGAAAAAGDRRLLPRPVLRVRRRRRPAAPGAWSAGAPARCRLPGVAAGGTAGRNDRLKGERMLLRPFLNDAGSCASYLFGCTSHNKLAVVDAHADLVDDYLAAAAAIGSPIVAVFETHVQADHLSGLPSLVERTGATAYLPAGAGVEFEHVELADGRHDRARKHGCDRDRNARPRARAQRVHGRRPSPRRRGTLAAVQRRLAADR